MSFLQFDFNGKNLCFCQPERVIQTHLISEVINCFQQLQQAIQQGYYVAGYIAYEAAPAFTAYLSTHVKGEMPLLWFGVYKQPTHTPPIQTSQPFTTPLAWQLNTPFDKYQQAIRTIKEQIANGNFYQINHTIRLNTTFDPSISYALYQQICQAQQADYCAYLDMGPFKLLSASPELFFHWQQGTITTKPMKGTIGRGKALAEDEQQSQLLALSAKDQAENLMIVDLLRNDLSKIAELDSIKVPQLFTIEKYPTVLQMTSTITAQTKTNTRLQDIFTALFPCGSITGAPKAIAMQTIKQLEDTPREAYCGAIGFVTPDQEAIFNVAIRTIKVNTSKHLASYGVGGGITWSSTEKAEYQEALTKAKILTYQQQPKELLESLLLIDGQYFLLSLHLKRLKDSAHYFNFKFNYQLLKKQLLILAKQHATGSYKVRLLLEKQGFFHIEAATLQATSSELQATWFTSPINSQNILLYHKTTHRDFYPEASLTKEYLLTNEQGEVTEFVSGNLVIFKQGKWLTPPVNSGLLAGTLRQWLLSKKFISEQILYKQDIESAEQILFINSVRGARRVTLD